MYDSRPSHISVDSRASKASGSTKFPSPELKPSASLAHEPDAHIFGRESYIPSKRHEAAIDNRLRAPKFASNRAWTSAQIMFKGLNDPAYPNSSLLDAQGKALYPPQTEYSPLYRFGFFYFV